MAKADVVTSVSILSNGLADTIAANNFYDEVVQELGRAPWLTNFTQISVFTQGQLVFALPSQSISLHGVIYSNRWLAEIRQREIEAYSRTWRRIGNADGPRAYVLDDTSHLSFSLFPTPGLPGAPIGVPPTYDKTFADGNVTVIYTEYRSTIPLWLETAVAFGVLAREYSRHSAHMDMEGAALAKQLGDLLMMMVS